MMRKNNVLRKYIASFLLFLLFETVAITLWKAKGNLFYRNWCFFICGIEDFWNL